MALRMDEERARAEFRRLADDEFQWWLRLPIANLLWRRDFIRYAVSLDYLLGQVLDALRAVNLVRGRLPPSGGPGILARLPLRPRDAAERIEEVCSLRDLGQGERESRALIRNVVDLGRERFGLEFPWLRKVRDPSRPRGSLLRPDPRKHLSLARRLARAYRELPGVAAVAVGESVASGLADRTSDLDLEILCRSVPAADGREELVCRSADDREDARVRHGKDETADEFFVEGILVDARYRDLPRWTALAAKPRPRSTWDEEALSHLDSMKASWDPEGMVSGAQTMLRAATARLRPRRLSQASVHLRRDVVRLDGLARGRCGNREFLSASADAATTAFAWLAALNDRWIVFPKWTRPWVERLRTSPPGFCRRTEEVFLAAIPRRRRTRVAAILGSLVRDLGRLTQRARGD